MRPELVAAYRRQLQRAERRAAMQRLWRETWGRLDAAMRYGESLATGVVDIRYDGTHIYHTTHLVVDD